MNIRLLIIGVLLSASAAVAQPRSEASDIASESLLVAILGAGNTELNAVLQKKARHSDLTQNEKSMLKSFDEDLKLLEQHKASVRPLCVIEKIVDTPEMLNTDPIPHCDSVPAKQLEQAPHVYKLRRYTSNATISPILSYRFYVTHEQRQELLEQMKQLYEKWNGQESTRTVTHRTTTTGAHTATSKVAQQMFQNFTMINSQKLRQLEEKRIKGVELTPNELQALDDAAKDDARLRALQIFPVCEVTAQHVEAERKTQISLGRMKDCATLPPAELAKTHEASAAIQTSFGKGGSTTYRYPGSVEEETKRVAEIKEITNKWKQWDQQP